MKSRAAIAETVIVLTLLAYFVLVPVALPSAVLQSYRLPMISDANYPIRCEEAYEDPSLVTRNITYTVLGQSVKYQGLFRVAEASPICTAEISCPRVPHHSRAVFYLVTRSGSVFQLIFTEVDPRASNTTPDLPDGSQVVVVGALIVPSSWQTPEWAPAYSFEGDIYVGTIGLVSRGSTSPTSTVFLEALSQGSSD